MAPRKGAGPSKSQRDRRSHSTAEKPQPFRFFKIMLPCTIEAKKLRIPNRFVRKFGEQLSDLAKIIGPCGYAWRIGLTKDWDNIWFDDGWQNFVEHYAIDCGYLLVFEYRGFSNFNVLIFDMSACGIKYTCTGATSGQKIDHAGKCLFDSDDKMDDPIEILGLESGGLDVNGRKGESIKSQPSVAEANHLDSPNLEHLNEEESGKQVKVAHTLIADLDGACESGMRGNELKENSMSSARAQPLFIETEDYGSSTKVECEEDSEIIAIGFTKASRASKRAIQAAKMFKHENPCFMVILRPYNFRKGVLNVPLEFGKRHMNQVPKYIKLQLSNGNEWPIRFIRNAYPRFFLSVGCQFFKGNNLVEGDVCVFEVNKGNASLLKVSIFRVAEYGSP